MQSVELDATGAVRDSEETENGYSVGRGAWREGSDSFGVCREGLNAFQEVFLDICSSMNRRRMSFISSGIAY